MYPSDRRPKCPKVSDDTVSQYIPRHANHIRLSLELFNEAISRGLIPVISGGEYMVDAYIKKMWDDFRTVFDMLLKEREKKIEAPSDRNQFNVVMTDIKSFFINPKTSGPSIFNYFKEKLNGMPLWKAHKLNRVTTEQVADAYTTAKVIQAEIDGDERLNRFDHMIKTKNHTTKKRVRIGRYWYNIKSEFENRENLRPDLRPAPNLPPIDDFNEDEYEEIGEPQSIINR